MDDDGCRAVGARGLYQTQIAFVPYRRCAGRVGEERRQAGGDSVFFHRDCFHKVYVNELIKLESPRL